MKQYKVTIQADRYPMAWTVEASSWSVAVARATRLWQQRFKRSRTEQLKITVVKGAVAQSNTTE